MEDNPNLAIIIVNWNSAQATLHCLSHISGWSGLRAEVIVVDNGSSKEDIATIQQSGQKFHILYNNSNLGYAGGNNTGITFALMKGFNFIMLLNSDASIDEQCIMKLLDCMDHKPGLGVIGPLLEEHGAVYSGGRNIGIYSNTRTRRVAGTGNSSLLNVDYVPGSAMIVKRETFENVGLLDEEYFFSGEIADFCMRVHTAGLMCGVFLECMAIHQPDPESGYRETLYNYYILRNRFLFVRKHFHYTRYFWYLRWIVGGTLQIIFATLSGKRTQALALWFGLRDGVIGRFGNRNDLFLS